MEHEELSYPRKRKPKISEKFSQKEIEPKKLCSKQFYPRLTQQSPQITAEDILSKFTLLKRAPRERPKPNNLRVADFFPTTAMSEVAKFAIQQEIESQNKHSSSTILKDVTSNCQQDQILKNHVSELERFRGNYNMLLNRVKDNQTQQFNHLDGCGVQQLCSVNGIQSSMLLYQQKMQNLEQDYFKFRSDYQIFKRDVMNCYCKVANIKIKLLEQLRTSEGN
eukprot:TRINITY_DN8237_c1_g1_i2.p1 TRINITY_DN8237_c1_g1~~TRINITY_DN8237_c1_g1_i2.p1  ORF type:complete len:222 (-),score=16.49 TRINITY_DN8237_c1_g1_i2:492-1157(-)